ncbi:MAG TPA: sulfatase-like hydrolase/transferase, partial [Pyrinomonadaceae bacterium]
MYDHIILISVDTLRADGIAANPLRLWPEEYGLSYELRTPVLDELVGQGAFFANTITAAPYTSASHASLLTGCWPPRHGAREFFGSRLAARTLFNGAKGRGYHTVLKTDFPVMLGAPLGFVSDVDRYLVEDDDAYVAALAGARRSCSLLHFGSVHIPYGFHNTRFGGRDYLEKVEALEAEVGQGGRDAPADVLSETFRTAEDLDLLLRYKQAVVALYAARRYD